MLRQDMAALDVLRDVVDVFQLFARTRVMVPLGIQLEKGAGERLAWWVINRAAFKFRLA
jgi:hypothetical protein